MITGGSALAELVARIATLDDPHPACRWLPAALDAVIPFDIASVHRLSVDGDDHHLESFGSTGFGDDEVALIHSYMQGRKQRFVLYNPAHPAPSDRNVVEFVKLKRGYLDLPLVRELYPRVGCAGRDEMRVLVCAGPSLLAWVGGWRKRPFDARERATLQRLVPPMRARLRAERRLAQAAIDRAGLLASLGRMPGIAIICDERARLRDGNAMALALHDVDPASLRDEILAAIAGQSGPHRFTVTALALHGAGRYFLVVGTPSGPSLGSALAMASARMRLTARETEVLSHILRGAANITIAEILGIRVRTVEAHVTALLFKAGVENRTSLATLVLQGGP